MTGSLKKWFFVHFPAVRFEPGTAGYEAQTLCDAVHFQSKYLYCKFCYLISQLLKYFLTGVEISCWVKITLSRSESKASSRIERSWNIYFCEVIDLHPMEFHHHDVIMRVPPNILASQRFRVIKRFKAVELIFYFLKCLRGITFIISYKRKELKGF